MLAYVSFMRNFAVSAAQQHLQINIFYFIACPFHRFCDLPRLFSPVNWFKRNFLFWKKYRFTTFSPIRKMYYLRSWIFFGTINSRPKYSFISIWFNCILPNNKWSSSSFGFTSEPRHPRAPVFCLMFYWSNYLFILFIKF